MSKYATSTRTSIVCHHVDSMDSIATCGSTRQLLSANNDSNLRLYSAINKALSQESCILAQNSHTGKFQGYYSKNGYSQRSALQPKQQNIHKDIALRIEKKNSVDFVHQYSCTDSSTISGEDACMQLEEAGVGGNVCPHRDRKKFTHIGTRIWCVCRTLKNLLVMSLSFMLLFTAFISLQSLQSSLHHAFNNIGVTSLSCYYGAIIVSCFIAPAVISKLTTKWTLIAGFIFYLIYIGTNFYPEKYLLIPSSLLLGSMTGPMWSAQSTYLTTLAIHYAQSTGQLQESVISSFNGIFFGFLQTSQVWGNLLSTAVLSADNITLYLNQVNESLLKHACGAKDCGYWDEFPHNALSHKMAPVTNDSKNILMSIYIAIVLMSVVLTLVLLDGNEKNTCEGSCRMSLSSQQLLFHSLKKFLDPRLQLLTPLVVFTGLEQGFILGDFTKSYINCALGIHNIGYVMMCFGAVNALFALIIGQIVKHIKRYQIMISGTLFNTGLLIVLLWWLPSLDDMPMFYVIASCLGLCDAIWQTQTNALFGHLFSENQEAAFSCYRILQCLGFTVAFGCNSLLCVNTKVYMMGCMLTIGIVLYSVVEIQQHKKRRLASDVTVL